MSSGCVHFEVHIFGGWLWQSDTWTALWEIPTVQVLQIVLTIKCLKSHLRNTNQEPLLCLKLESHDSYWMLSFSCLFAYLHIIFLKIHGQYFIIFNSDSVGHPDVCRTLERHVSYQWLSSLDWLGFLDNIESFSTSFKGDLAFLSRGDCWDRSSQLVPPLGIEGKRTFRSAGMFSLNTSKRQHLCFVPKKNTPLLDVLALSNSSNRQTQPLPIWLSAVATKFQADCSA